MAKKNFYSILEIDSQVSDEDLKKAYRKLAFSYHPDRNNGNKEAEEKFKEISEAYAVLSDKEKRAYYDRYGHAKFRQRYEQEDFFSGVNFADAFQDIFYFQGNRPRGFGCRGRGGGRGCGMGIFGGKEFLYELSLTDSEASLGTEKKILLDAGWQTIRVLIKIPPKVKDGTIIRLIGENQQEEVFLRIKVV